MKRQQRVQRAQGGKRWEHLKFHKHCGDAKIHFQKVSQQNSPQVSQHRIKPRTYTKKLPTLPTSVVRVKSFCNKTPHKSLDPESNRGLTDYLDTLQSAALPTELSREE